MQTSQFKTKPRAKYINRYLLWPLLAIPLIASVRNASFIYDDLYLLDHFEALLSKQGFINAIKILLLNLDLPGEFRFYGVSKILHFGLWCLAGKHAWCYSFFITASQVAAGLGLYRLLTRYGIDKLTAETISTIWIFSPFLVTNCFHHYSYSILPYQLLIICLLIIQSSQKSREGLPIKMAMLLGVIGSALALTGESHYVTTAFALLTFIIFGVFSKASSKIAISSGIPLLTFAGTALFYYFIRGTFVALDAQPQRFAVVTTANRSAAEILPIFISSIGNSFESQIKTILSNTAYSPHFLLIAGFVLMVSLLKLITDTTPNPGSQRNIPILTAVTAAAFITSIAVFLSISILTGMISKDLPRRYGYIPYTFLCIFIAVFVRAAANRCTIFGKATTQALPTFVMLLWASLCFSSIPRIRHEDALFWENISKAASAKTNPALLFAKAYYHPHNANYQLTTETPGMRGQQTPDIFESALSAYWWEAQYAKAVLGIQFVGDHYTRTGIDIQLYGNGLTSPEFSTISPDQLIIAAGESLKDDSNTFDQVVIYKSLESFQKSPARIGVNVGLILATLNSQTQAPTTTINFSPARGESPVSEYNILCDKNYNDLISIDDKIVKNYGYISGTSQSHSNKAFPHISYFSSNRYGDFIYQIDFQTRSMKSISLDFFEMWHSQPKARVFKLEIALDDTWINLGNVDLYALAGQNPFFITVYSDDAKSIKIRTTSQGKDVPFINGVRVSDVAEAKAR
jgi:hypothetical protein